MNSAAFDSSAIVRVHNVCSNVLFLFLHCVQREYERTVLC